MTLIGIIIGTKDTTSFSSAEDGAEGGEEEERF